MYTVWLGHGYLGKGGEVVAWKAHALAFGSFEEAETAMKGAKDLYDPEGAWPFVAVAE
jgi:hypothetical protein